MNLFVGIGRLTADPVIRYSQGAQGTKIATFTLAIDRKYKREGQPTADFLRCKAFTKTADIIEQYTQKGKQVSVTGEVQTDSYKKQDGSTVYTTEIIINQLTLLGSPNDVSRTKQHAQAPAPAPEPQQTAIPEEFEPYEGEEDLPF